MTSQWLKICSRLNSANQFSMYPGFNKSTTEIQFYWNQQLSTGHKCLAGCATPCSACRISGGLLHHDKPQQTVGSGTGTYTYRAVSTRIVEKFVGHTSTERIRRDKNEQTSETNCTCGRTSLMLENIPSKNTWVN